MSDTYKIILMRSLRQFAYGSLAVTLAVALTARGLSPEEIGGLVTISLAGDFCGSVIIGYRADIWGRRKTILGLSAIMMIVGVVLSVTSSFIVLVITAFLGTMGTAASETAPFLPIEQAILGHVTETKRRTGIFARYNFAASISTALGSGYAALVASVAKLAGLSFFTAADFIFINYAALAIGVLLIAATLSPSVEIVKAQSQSSNQTIWQRLAPPMPKSHKNIFTLAALFSVDAFGGALIGQTLLALFFHLRFHADLSVLGLLFLIANMLAALSMLYAEFLAEKFGLLQTMVFTHLPSNVLLILAAIVPIFPIAALLFLLRQSLSQLDVPTRQAYTMAMTAPEERTAASSVTSLGRSAGSALAPLLTGALTQGAFIIIGAPLLLAGGIKIVYDLLLWRVFAKVKI